MIYTRMRKILSFRLFEQTLTETDRIVAFHGTYGDFKKFDMSYQGKTDEGYYGRGFYFSPDKEEASEYGLLVLECVLHIKNPFYLRTWTTMGGYEEIELRDDLSKLKGIPDYIKPDRKLPDGYKVSIIKDHRHYRGEIVTAINIVPQEKFYGTDKEIYGDSIYLLKKDADNPETIKGYTEMAIVSFNDMINGVEVNGGLANWLLQSIGRDNFTEILENNGYDGLFVVREKGNKTPLDEVIEFMVWDPDKIEIKARHYKGKLLKESVSSFKERFNNLTSFEQIDNEMITDIIENLEYSESYNFDDEEVFDDLSEKMEEWKKLPDPVTLYRVVVVSGDNEPDTRTPGEHWTQYKWNLDGDMLLSIGADEMDDEQLFVLVASVPHSEINIQQTIIQNLMYPTEHEINVKDEGRNVRIMDKYILE
jgi:hypothetical protein